MARRASVTVEQIREAIEDIAARGDRPETRAVREELGGMGDYSRIQAVLDEWREDQDTQRVLSIPEMPDVVRRAVDLIWPQAYRAADGLLETKRAAFENERLTYESAAREMAQEIAALEAARDAAEAEAERVREEVSALQQELESVGRERAADQATMTELRREVMELRGAQGLLENKMQEERDAWMEQRNELEKARIGLEIQAEQMVAALERSGEELRQARTEIETQAKTLTHVHETSDEINAALAAAEARVQVLSEQNAVLQDNQQARDTALSEWTQRAATAEAELKVLRETAAAREAEAIAAEGESLQLLPETEAPAARKRAARKRPRPERRKDGAEPDV